MMNQDDKNLLLAEDGYPHLPNSLVKRLREFDSDGLTMEIDLLMSEAADSIDQYQVDYIELDFENKYLKDEVTELRAKVAEYEASQETTVPDNMQEWTGMDGATAFHLIERHSNNWSDAGKMMADETYKLMVKYAPPLSELADVEVGI